MNWQTWTKFSSIILFIIAVTGFYLGNFYADGVILNIDNFPQSLSSLDNDQDIFFTFYLYNKGDTTAFIQSITLDRSYEDGTLVADTEQITPKEDFSIAPGESKEISIILPNSAENKQYSLQATIYFDNEKLSTNSILVAWGTLL